jgi:hypothetical protein
MAGVVIQVGRIPESWLQELSPIDRLAVEADLDPDELRAYLEAEIERRRAEAHVENRRLALEGRRGLGSTRPGNRGEALDGRECRPG